MSPVFTKNTKEDLHKIMFIEIQFCIHFLQELYLLLKIHSFHAEIKLKFIN